MLIKYSYKFINNNKSSNNLGNLMKFPVDRSHLDYSSFDAQGGLGKMWQLFGEGMDPLLDELNEALVA